MRWEVIDTGCRSAQENMLWDAEMLSVLAARERPILHLYEWAGDSATFGHFVDPADYLDLAAADKRGLQLARRSTGGGIVFHIWDMAFSVLVPVNCPEFSLNTLENYAFVNNAVLLAVKEFLGESSEMDLIPSDAFALDKSCERFCMAKPTKYDVILGKRKIAGAAQRKRKEGFLHQGTIALVMPDEGYLADVLLPGSRVLEAMQAHTFALLGTNASQLEIVDAKRELRQLLASSLNSMSLQYLSTLQDKG